jgi:hypothetical protein
MCGKGGGRHKAEKTKKPGFGGVEATLSRKVVGEVCFLDKGLFMGTDCNTSCQLGRAKSALPGSCRDPSLHSEPVDFRKKGAAPERGRPLESYLDGR